MYRGVAMALNIRNADVERTPQSILSPPYF